MGNFDIVNILIDLAYFAGIAFLVFVFFILIKANRLMNAKLAEIKKNADKNKNGGPQT
jgi:hypothetical protein